MNMSAERAPFPSDSYAELAAAEGENWWFKSRNRILISVLRGKVDHFKDYLEVGCGTGFVLEGVRKAFPQACLRATEYYDEGLAFARKRIPDARFERMDAVQMREVARYDVIGAFDVIEHIEQDVVVLQNLARAVRPGGSVVITVPQHMWLWSTVDEKACHVRRYGRKELLEKIGLTDLKVQYVTSFVCLLLPLMWVARLRAKTSNYKSESELKMSRPLNFLLEMVMRVEFLLMKMGIRLPAGGSLLVVARKPTQEAARASDS